jgi:hypothetical protein
VRQGGERKEVDTVGEVRGGRRERETVRVEGRREEETVRRERETQSEKRGRQNERVGRQ